MFDEADALQKDVFVARDASFGKGAKEYASLQNHEQLAKLLLSSLDRECCMYELIREGRPCKLYLDLEWESENMGASDAHKMLLNVVWNLHTFLEVCFFVFCALCVFLSTMAQFEGCRCTFWSVCCASFLSTSALCALFAMRLFVHHGSVFLSKAMCLLAYWTSTRKQQPPFPVDVPCLSAVVSISS
jgi:hypothetical protein